MKRNERFCADCSKMPENTQKSIKKALKALFFSTLKAFFQWWGKLDSDKIKS